MIMQVYMLSESEKRIIRKGKRKTKNKKETREKSLQVRKSLSSQVATPRLGFKKH